MTFLIALAAVVVWAFLVMEVQTTIRRRRIHHHEHATIADLEQRNQELDQLLHELDPEQFSAPVTLGPLDEGRLDALRDEYRAEPPARKRTLMEEAQVENRRRTLAAVDAAITRDQARHPMPGWEVDRDAVALMFEAPWVTIHALADVSKRDPETIRCALLNLGIMFDPVRDVIRGRDAFRLFQEKPTRIDQVSKERWEPRTHTRGTP